MQAALGRPKAGPVDGNRLAALCGLLVALAFAGELVRVGGGPAHPLEPVLSAVASVGALTAAIVVLAVDRQIGEGRAALVGATLAVFGVNQLPGVIEMFHNGPVLGAVRLASGAMLLGLLVAVASGRREPRRLGGWRTAALCLCVPASAGLLAYVLPAWWCGVVDGVPPPAGHGLACCAVPRLTGLALALLTVVALVRRAVGTLERTHREQQEALCLARRDLRAAAERDHEVRNAVAGLAGATSLLAGPNGMDGADSAVLRGAVSAELERLDALLNGTREPVTSVFEVLPVLRRQVALRRCAGMDIRLDADPDLRAAGSAEGFAQVIANVLANCARHAAGSRVHVRAAAQRGTVRIEVTDLGPGVPPGAERAVFDAGVRGAESPGDGLGLHLCRRLLEPHGGYITIRPRPTHRSPGCTVVIDLPERQLVDAR